MIDSLLFNLATYRLRFELDELASLSRVRSCFSSQQVLASDKSYRSSRVHDLGLAIKAFLKTMHHVSEALEADVFFCYFFSPEKLSVIYRDLLKHFGHMARSVT